MRKSFLLLTFATLAAAPALARADAYWVFLKDKGTETQVQQALGTLPVTYSPDAIERRELRGVQPAPFTAGDLPVLASYVSSITGSGVTLREQSAWLNAVSINADAGQLSSIAALPFVDHVQRVASFSAPQTVGAPTIASASAMAAASTDFYGAAQAQLDQIKIPQVHAAGYTGAGVTIGILDTGFKRTHEAFNTPGHVVNILGEHDFINNVTDTSSTVDSQHTHGTFILGTMGAYKPNTLVGGAYNASFLLAKTEVVPTETQIEEDHWVAGLEWLEQNGADVVTSSLGYYDWYTQSQLDGKTAVTSIAAQAAAKRGLPIVNAAGNLGHDFNATTSHLMAPADAELVITVGAASLTGSVAGFSSDGPTADGRIKPEVLALGVSTMTVHPDDDTLYVGVSGTSLSTPLVTSAVALLIEAHPNWTVEDIRWALFSTAPNFQSPEYYNFGGYGVIDAYAALNAVVPEPSTLGIFFVGILALTQRRRRL